MRSYGVPTAFLRRSCKFLKRYINLTTCSKRQFWCTHKSQFHVSSMDPYSIVGSRSRYEHEPVGYCFRTFFKTVFGDVGMYYLRLVDCFRFVQHATSTCMIAHLQRSRSRMCAKWPYRVLYFCCHYICAECLWSHFVILPPHCCATNQSPCVILISNYSATKENKWAESPEISRLELLTKK